MALYTNRTNLKKIVQKLNFLFYFTVIAQNVRSA